MTEPKFNVKAAEIIVAYGEKELHTDTIIEMMEKYAEDKVKELEANLADCEKMLKFKKADCLERDMIWLPAKDAEIEERDREISALKGKLEVAVNGLNDIINSPAAYACCSIAERTVSQINSNTNP